jgi:hypothetical protein
VFEDCIQVLETLIKNCGDNVHQQIAEKDVLNEMVKIVRKKVRFVACLMLSHVESTNILFLSMSLLCSAVLLPT